MKLIDTCGWIEELTAGPLAEQFSPALQHPEELIVPTVVQYELYKWVCRERDEMTALAIIDITRQCQVIPLDTSLALLAASLARQYQLSVADAIIYATAQQEAVLIIILKICLEFAIFLNWVRQVRKIGG